MSQQRIVRKAKPCPGGWMVSVEVTSAFTDGRSRFDEVFVADEAVRGKTDAQKRQAMVDALRDELAPFSGAAIEAPAESKEILEDRMEALYADWQRWKTTRVEAQSRSLAAAVVTALTNREDASWSKYVTAIQAWRTAP